MNVGITRAAHALWLLGNADTLAANEHWAALLADARARNCIIAAADAQALFPDATLWHGPNGAPSGDDAAARAAAGGAEAAAPASAAAAAPGNSAAPPSATHASGHAGLPPQPAPRSMGQAKAQAHAPAVPPLKRPHTDLGSQHAAASTARPAQTAATAGQQSGKQGLVNGHQNHDRDDIACCKAQQGGGAQAEPQDPRQRRRTRL